MKSNLLYPVIGAIDIGAGVLGYWSAMNSAGPAWTSASADTASPSWSDEEARGRGERHGPARKAPRRA
jgi:hypothetical protein